ncbi:hypothetical protein L1049_016321 [Liquidambar formosana]|uniref:Uncharacterized protein n=1 Tax=Liquidambar formosana TaxID=63359 RepID=A0AAP0S0G2_LIQFO
MGKQIIFQNLMGTSLINSLCLFDNFVVVSNSLIFHLSFDFFCQTASVRSELFFCLSRRFCRCLLFILLFIHTIATNYKSFYLFILNSNFFSLLEFLNFARSNFSGKCLGGSGQIPALPS